MSDAVFAEELTRCSAGSQLLSFLSSQGLKHPDERMFLSRELLSRGYIAHVPAGSKQPNVLDFCEGNRYRYTQKVPPHRHLALCITRLPISSCADFIFLARSPAHHHALAIRM